LKRAEVSYAELARRLKEHGLEETEASITAKLNRGTFAATFFLATMKAIGRDIVNLADVVARRIGGVPSPYPRDTS
jgi:Domain of unknown function (DUF6471)